MRKTLRYPSLKFAQSFRNYAQNGGSITKGILPNLHMFSLQFVLQIFRRHPTPQYLGYLRQSVWGGLCLCRDGRSTVGARGPTRRCVSSGVSRTATHHGEVKGDVWPHRPRHLLHVSSSSTQREEIAPRFSERDSAHATLHRETSTSPTTYAPRVLAWSTGLTMPEVICWRWRRPLLASRRG